MGSLIRFTSTKLEAKGKKGLLTADENGYYEIVVGGLNTFNSGGEYYTLEGAKELFESSSTLMRRIKSGNLRGELDHPAMLPGQTMRDYISRLLRIDRDREVCHISEIWLDEEYGKKYPECNNPNLVAIMAKVKPSGPKGFMLEQSLNNPKENTCFSIRALYYEVMYRGRVNRILNNIITWDLVNEPGIAGANKYDSPALEDINIMVTESMVDDLLAAKMGIATEDSKEILSDVKRQMRNERPKNKLYDWR